MEWEFFAPMLLGMTGMLTVGGVLILRPIATKLGALLEVMAREKAQMPAQDDRRLVDTLEMTNQRLALLEERLDFTERLLGRGEALEPPPTPHARMASDQEMPPRTGIPNQGSTTEV